MGVLWTEGAFKKLHEIYGTLKSGAPMKKGYILPRAQMENADIARIINSTEVQSVLRPKLEAPKSFPKKRNALKNKEGRAEGGFQGVQQEAQERRRHILQELVEGVRE